MKKLFFALSCVAIAAIVACGGKKTENPAQEGEQNKENTAEQATQTEEQQPEQQADATQKAQLTLVVDSVIPENMKAVYANGDFMPCKAVFFADDLSGEKMGEFPSKWSLSNGDAEVAKFDDKMVIHLSNNDAHLLPKVAGESKNYLPEVYTIEFDYYCNGDEDFNATYHLFLGGANGDDAGEITLYTEDNVSWNMRKTDGEYISGSGAIGDKEKKNAWNHFSISQAKDKMKVYINGHRVANLVGVENPGSFSIKGENHEDHRYYFTNIRMTTELPAASQQ